MFEKIFLNYVSKFDIENEGIKLKFNHSLRVKNLAVKYSRLLGYDERELKMAEFIGLFHDIGRFRQIADYHTYDDRQSIDHAYEGLLVLDEEKIFDKTDFTEEEIEIIKFAIKNHSKYAIEECDDERKMKFARFIKDMDKLDIIYLFAFTHEGDETQCVDNPLDEELVKDIKEHRLLMRCDKENYFILAYFSYAFDIYNPIVYDELEYNIKHYYKRLNNEKLLADVYKEVMDYIEMRKKEC